MCAEQYLLENRQELFRIFTDIVSGRSTELIINPNLDSDTLDKECCRDAVIVHRYLNNEVDFPIKYPENLTEFDENLAIELYSIVLCEEGVKNGHLTRDGARYIPTKEYVHFKPDPKYRKYVLLK